jgi:hypothetical protein
MALDISIARNIAQQFSDDSDDEAELIEGFAQICHFLDENPDRLSWRGKNKPSDIRAESVLQTLARKYFSAYRSHNVPHTPKTIPDSAVSMVLIEAFNYSEEDINRIKIEHKRAMSAENSVGALLERYIDSVLRHHGWYWCCGDFVKAVDFISRDQQDNWLALQVKNRDNSENSSSSAIRDGTHIQKWFRSFSRTGTTNWHDMPSLMQGYGLSEEGFLLYIRRI